MAVLLQFYSRHDSDGGSEFFALAREAITDEVFVIRTRSKPDDAVCPYQETRIELADFLNESGPGRSDLLGLIGTLVVEK